MQTEQEAAIKALVQQMAENGAEDTASALSGLFELARKMEGDDDHDKRRRDIQPAAPLGHRKNGTAEQVEPRVEMFRVGPSQAARPAEPVPVRSLEHGRRSSRALMLALAEMYLKGVSTPDAEEMMAKCGVDSLSNIQASEAAVLLDEELRAWCNRRLAETSYLMLGARCEKVRDKGTVHDVAVLSAIGIGPDQRRRILGFSCAPTGTALHWETFLDSLVERGMRGVQFLVSDDHTGLRIARESTFPGVPWQRCQHHLVRNAMHYAPDATIRKRLTRELREVWAAPSRQSAMRNLDRLVSEYIGYAPTLARWLNDNVPEGLAVFNLPRSHWRFMRSSNSMERTIQLAIKKCTQQVRIFPSTGSLERLVGAVLVEIDETWATADQPYIRWDDENGGADRVVAAVVHQTSDGNRGRVD